MKKILIPAFFVGMIMVTYIVAKAAASIRLNDVDITFKTYQNTLSDTEIAKRNESRAYTNPLPTEDAEVIQCYDVKEIRTKTFLSWDLKVDTLRSYVNIVRRK